MAVTEIGGSEHDRGQGHRVHPIAEDRDHLAGPEGRERAVERQAHVRVLEDAVPDWWRGGGDRGEGRRREPSANATEDHRALQGRNALQRRGKPRLIGAAGAETDARGLVVDVCRGPHDAGKQEEGEARHQEDVADRRHGLDDRDRDRDDVPEQAQSQQEVGVERRRQNDVEGRRDIARNETGGREAWLPDRHVAAVHHDRERVRQRPDEGERHPRIRPVGPQGREQQGERDRDEGEPQRRDQVDVGGQQPIGSEPDQQRSQQERDPAQTHRGEMHDPPARQQPHEQAQRDPGQDHRVIIRRRASAYRAESWTADPGGVDAFEGVSCARPWRRPCRPTDRSAAPGAAQTAGPDRGPHPRDASERRHRR